MHFKGKSIFKELVSFLNSPFFIILSRDSDNNFKQSYKYEISSRCENHFCLVSIEIFRWLKSFCKIDTFKLNDVPTETYKTINKICRTPFIVCLDQPLNLIKISRLGFNTIVSLFHLT